MARLTSFEGITVAEKDPAKKLPCPDCTFCQWCSDDRCRMCRKKSCGKKLSLREQIELYERINAERQKT